MAKFSPSTIEMVGNINGGVHCATGSLAATTYLVTGGTQNEIFNVYGRILVLQLYLEVTTVLSANASQVLFNATWTTPVIAAVGLCAKCASVSAAAVGRRVVCVGGAVATAAVITAAPGISDVTMVTPHIIGATDFVGTIGTLSTDATCTSGAMVGHIHYIPYSQGAYVTAVA